MTTKYTNNTTLSEHIWKLKTKQEKTTQNSLKMTCKIKKECSSLQQHLKTHHRCLEVKIPIITFPKRYNLSSFLRVDTKTDSDCARYNHIMLLKIKQNPKF